MTTKSENKPKVGATPGAYWKVISKPMPPTGEEVLKTLEIGKWCQVERIGDKYYKASIGDYNFDVTFEERTDSHGLRYGFETPTVRLKQSSAGERLAREAGASYLERRADELLAKGTPESFLLAREYREEAKAFRMGADRP